MRSILPVLLLLAFLAGMGADAAVAASKGRPGSSPSSPLQSLIKAFDDLDKDAAKGARRDTWLALEDKFAALRAKSKGDTATQAAFYHARARQELGRRSFLGADHREAAKRYAALAAAAPSHALAAECLLRQGQILEYRLKDHAAARAALERLQKSYSTSKAAAAGKKVLADVEKNAAADKAAASAQGAASGARGAGKTGGSTVTLQKISWKGGGQKAVITLALDGGAEFAHSFQPPDPAKKTPGRLLLDLERTLPGNAVKPGLSPKNLVVSRIKTSRSGDGTRVTLECDGVRCYTVSSPRGAPQTIRIEVSRKNNLANGIAVGEAVQAGGRAPASVMEQLGLTVNTIMLDAGHGGKDPGAQAGGITEKRFTLAMAKRVGALLKQKGFRVLYTRASDNYISLQDRPDIANNKKADLFISIHVNANSNAGIHGIETYYLDEAKTQDAAVVAARENAVSVKNISDLQFILTDLMLSSKVKESHQLADCVQGGILRALKRSRLATRNNGVRSAPFYVLMGARMPAVLVEFGYITNAADAGNLKSEAYLQRQAEGLVDGIVRYKAELAKMAPR